MDLSSDELKLSDLALPGLPLEIEDCILLNRAIISSLLDDLGALMARDDFSFSSISLLPGALLELFFGPLPFVLPSDVMLERVGLSELKGIDLSAISAKFNKLHQQMIPQFLVYEISDGPGTTDSCVYNRNSMWKLNHDIYVMSPNLTKEVLKQYANLHCKVEETGQHSEVFAC